MQKKWTHHQQVPNFRKAGHFVLPHCHCILRQNHALQVRSRHDVHRAISGAARIKVQAHRDHLFEEAGRRLHIPAVLLARPATQERIFDALLHRNAQVLVHRHQPVHRIGLFEESALNRNMGSRQQALKCWRRRQGVGQFGAPGL